MTFKRFRINRIRRKYFKSFSILASSALISQLIPVLISPILTRIYSPHEFGILGIYVSISSILNTITNGRYEMAIVLPEKEEEANNLTAGAILINIGFSIFILFLIVIFNTEITKLLNEPALSFWLYLIPITVFMGGVFTTFNYLSIRQRKYKNIAKANILKSTSSSFLQLIIPLFKLSGNGLVWGNIFQYFTGNFILSKEYIFSKGFNSSISKEKILKVFKRYSNFPLFSIVSSLANTLVRNIIVILISNLYTSVIVGYYSFANRILAAPTGVISNSISQIFFERAATEKKNTGQSFRTFKKSLMVLSLIAFPLFMVIYFFAEQIFGLVFGKEWIIAGKYVKILTPLFFIRFIVSPLSVLMSIHEKQRFEMIWQVLLLLLLFISYTISKIFSLNIEIFLLLTTFTLSLHYLFLLLKLAKFSRIASSIDNDR